MNKLATIYIIRETITLKNTEGIEVSKESTEIRPRVNFLSIIEVQLKPVDLPMDHIKIRFKKLKKLIEGW